MIYFIQPSCGGPIKIGHTANVEERLRQLEEHYGQPLAVLFTMEGGRDEELDIHRRFAHLRFGQSEQFKPSSELMEFIGFPSTSGVESELATRFDPVSGIQTITIRATREYSLWLRKLAKEQRRGVSDFIDQLIAAHADSIGRGPAPSRLPS